MRELRVALIIDALDGRHAAGGQVSLLAQRLDRRRFTATVCVLGRAEAGMVERLRQADIKVHVFDRTHGHDVRVLYRLKELLATSYADIACTWMPGANVMGRPAALWSRVPVIVAVEQETAPRSFVRQQIDRLLARRTDALVADSEATAARAREACGKDGRLQLIRPGVEFRPPEEPTAPLPDVPPGWNVAVAAAPLIRPMGLLHLIWALSILRYADQPLQLWIAGEGPEKSRLAEEAARLDVGSRVHFLGRRDDMSAVLQRADVFVLPCRQGETSLAALDAMAAGIPVVLPDVPGFRGLADFGRCGRLVEPGYPKSIAAGMFQAIKHADQSQQMAALAKTRIREHYAAGRFVRQYEDLFVELAEAAGLGT
ncbi:MAG: glycosyltransferase [Planctomycetes bacterium]|nr:glycosyltransferase [Planctomycetota bacterium]